MTERFLRICDVCGVLDDAPRDNKQVPPDYPGAVPTQEFIDALPDGVPARALVELLDPSYTTRHFDCCAAAGCVGCQQAVAALAGDVRSTEALASIEAGAINHLTNIDAVIGD